MVPTGQAPADVPQFLDSILSMRQRRAASPDERAAVIWWREQVRALAKRAPQVASAAPTSTDHAAAA
jgi:hypothetical protein